MTSLRVRPITQLFALSSFAALYTGAYRSAALCAALSLVSLIRSESASIAPQLKGRPRSLSAPLLPIHPVERAATALPLNLVPTSTQADLFLSLSPSPPLVEVWQTVESGKLPRRVLSLVERAALLVGYLPPRNPPEIIERVIDLPRGYRLAHFREHKIFEVGDLPATPLDESIIAVSSRLEGYKIDSLGQDFLLLLGGQWRLPGFLPQNYFSHINYRLLDHHPTISEAEMGIFGRALDSLPKGRFSRIDLWFKEIDGRTPPLIDLLEERGELRCIYDYMNLSSQAKCEERMGPPDRLLVAHPSQLHLIYQKGGGERAQTELVKLRELPQKKGYFWWISDPFPTALEVVNGIVDLRASASVSLDWDELFPKEEPLSLEVGEVFGAAARTRDRGGHWVVMTNWPQAALNVEKARQGGLTQPLILFGNNWRYPSFFPKGRFKRIDVRLLYQLPLSFDQQIARFAEALGEGGELRLIFYEGEPKIDDYRVKMELSDGFNFLRSEAVEETIVFVNLPLVGRHRDTRQTHLIYRRRE